MVEESTASTGVGPQYNPRQLVSILSSGLSWIDLLFLGRPHAIATVVVRGAGTIALIDPGPSSCLESLELGLQQQGLRLSEVTHLLLTHVHLDHAGATGTIVRRHPEIQVLVHERGAPHIIDPDKLLASAARLYGDQMSRLWGEVTSVPASNVIVLGDRDEKHVGGRMLESAYTPGHAAHHVSYFDPSTRIAFVGDTAGVCIDDGYVLPPTPPPDIDLDLWRKSVARIEAWNPETLFLTHFGPVTQPRPHMQTLLENLDMMAEWVRGWLSEPGTEESRKARFGEQLLRELRRRMTESQLAAYGLAAPPDLLWLGLARYWRKKLS